MMRRIAPAVIAGLAAAVPAGAIGLGPLSQTGLIDGPSRAFELVVFNPYQSSERFRAYAVASDNEAPQARVSLSPAEITLGGGQTRRVLVVAHDLVPGESFAFRVCAERDVPPEGIAINARVCSKLTARRVS